LDESAEASEFSKFDKAEGMPAVNFDYIVIGTGSSGSAVAGRLSEDARNKVLVLEAGGSDRRLPILMPAATYLFAIGNPRYDWRYTAAPDPTRSNRRDYMPRGKVLGGTSSINGMCYVRGQPEDFDTWAKMGCKGWEFANVLPYFKRAENNENGADEFHGVGGPLSVSNIRSPHPLSEIFLQACVTAGLPRKADINRPPQDGIGYLQATQRGGRRCSSARAYLWPAQRRPNLNLLTHAHVVRINFEGRRAAGVDFVKAGRRQRATAARAVILCAGALASPQILMLSGVGPEAHLREKGIPVVHDLPGVGQNFHDHPGTTHTAWVRDRTYNVQRGLFRYFLYGAQWLLTGTGPGSTPDAHVIGFTRSRPQLERCDIQYHFTPAGYDLTENGPILLDRPAATGLVNIHRPLSRGWIRLKTADPFDQPEIQPNLLADENDRETLIRGHKIMRRIFDSEPMSQHVIEEFLPGRKVQTDDEWHAYVQESAIGFYHQAGSCKMGADPLAVLDERLRVRGVESLFVADASIMPVVVSGNLNANCIMIGEKCADMIRQDT
jgi:choline dehydrogenase